ncbi:MAG: hypothetical protein B6I38_07670 [Anaerolineaceae bacterium 4572_5.1]|nr:MAG: hypothetical protein B6I38_07670 [Anaerolineaceae bacterium 4572_5.1]
MAKRIFISQQPSVIIIGGGIIGVCSAYYLARKGVPVTLLEKDRINAGSTYGNAGFITPSDSLPVPAPGVLTQGMRWLMDAASPFYIKPTLKRDMLQWLWNFQKACNEKAWKEAVPILTELSVESQALFEEIIESEKLSCEYQQQGLMLLYKKEETFQEGQQMARKLEEYGISAEVFPADGLQSRFPPALPELTGGIFYKSDAHFDPAAFNAQLAQRVREMGVKIRENTEVLNFTVEAGRIREVHTTTGTYLADQIVLAAGAWTPGLGKQLDLQLAIQPAKGYSITVQRPENYPELPLLLDETKIAVTPIGDTLRFAGTLELAGLGLEINQKRLNAIRHGVEDYLDVDLDVQPLVEIWRGLRPCSPDGLPLLGRSERYANLIVASGHCMLGISQGTMTGKLVAEIALGENLSMDVESMRIERF